MNKIPEGYMLVPVNLLSELVVPQPVNPDEERLAMEAVMESVDPATWPGLTIAQRCALGRFAKPQPFGPADQHPDDAAPAVGEEIMVNTPYDVLTLPLQPSGLSSGPRFVVHVPGPEHPEPCPGTGCTDQGCPAHYSTDHQPAPDVAGLVGLLEHAQCPNCDGSGARYDYYGEPEQCQWCHERAEALAAYRKQGDDHEPEE